MAAPTGIAKSTLLYVDSTQRTFILPMHCNVWARPVAKHFSNSLVKKRKSDWAISAWFRIQKVLTNHKQNGHN